MSANWTQAWVSPNDSFFVRKDAQFIAPDPLIVQSTNGSTMVLSVGNDSAASITTASTGGVNNNAIVFDDKGISFNVDQPYDTLLIGDDVDVNTNLFITDPTGSNYCKVSANNSFNDYGYYNATDNISLFRMDSDGRIIFASGPNVDPQKAYFLVQTPAVSFFSQGGSNVNTVMAFVQNLSNSLPAARGVFVEVGDLSNAPGQLGGIIRFTAASGLNDTLDVDTGLQLVTVTGGLIQRNGPGATVGYNCAGGGDGNYGGSLFTGPTVNGIQLQGTNFGTNTAANLKLYGNVITIGGPLSTGGSSTTNIVGAFTINGFGVVSPTSQCMGSFVPPGNYSGYGGYTINVPISTDMANRNSIILEFQIYVGSGDNNNTLDGVRVNGSATGFNLAQTNVLFNGIAINYSGYCTGQLILYQANNYNFTSTSLNIGISSTGGRMDVYDPVQNNQIYYRTTYSLIGYT